VSQAANAQSLEALSRPSLERLVQEFRETVSVYVRIGASRLCIVRQEGLESLRHSVQVGVPMPLHVGSAGRILLAWLTPIDRQALIAESVKSTQIPESTPLPNWTGIQAQGWAMTVGERDPILASISVPIFDDKDDKKEVLAALSISGPRQRFTLDCVDSMIHCLQEEARLIQGLLHGSPRIE
jgi:DNA-binding IclR family transcriptional regulator